MIWGFGDGSTLNVVDTPCGRIATMICWESYMPLPATRCTRRASKSTSHRPTTAAMAGSERCSTSRAKAAAGSSAAGRCSTRATCLPIFPTRRALYPDADEWINDGDSVVVAPAGGIVAGPLQREAGILYADIDLDAVAAARRRIDVAGHYARPDVFRLHVNRQPQSPVSFD